MTTLTINLPDSLGEFVQRQAAANGHSSVEEYIQGLLRDLQCRQDREQIDVLLLQGLQTPAKEMTPDDWAELRHRIASVPEGGAEA